MGFIALGTEEFYITIHIALLVTIAISYLADTLKRYLYDDLYIFFKENRNQMLGIYYIYLTWDTYRKWKTTRTLTTAV
jgi:hypothetical protein